MHHIVPYVAKDVAPIACLAETIIETVREALLVVDQNLRLLWANTSFYRLFPQHPPKPESLLSDLHDDIRDLRGLQDLVRQVFASGQDVLNQEIQCAKSAKKNDTLIVQARRLRLMGYAEPIVLLSLEDISELKRAQQKLKDYRHDLEQKVRQRTQHLTSSNEQLRRLATLDSLTGIANRHSFEQVIHHEWSRAQREQTPLSVILIDIDFFKAYNDQYGHLHGDECLKNVAQALRGTLRRTTDFIGRFGGEEFVAVLPNTPLRGAKILAEKFRSAVENLHLNAAKKTVSEWLTVSIGVAECLPQRNNGISALIEAADQALYRAKEEGRNRVAGSRHEAEKNPAPSPSHALSAEHKHHTVAASSKTVKRRRILMKRRKRIKKTANHPPSYPA